MTKNMIEVENLSKCYHLQNGSGNTTLIEAMKDTASSCYQFLKNPLSFNKKKLSTSPFWALSETSFKVEQGDKLGIIGRNGAGKSTLLKLLSRITEPTSGKITLRGRVASLLEVGTGFHYELTGRENIFLNGAILGMSKKEILRKFDEIVAFAEIEAFLETPVKRFSSGMATRLGFAIAAHLESEVMIVDEVLAVGDATFQEKCLKKLNQLGNSGRTVLFVSHDIGSILTLCNKGLFLEKGKMHTYGNIETCVNAYNKSNKDISSSWEGEVGDENLKIFKATLNPSEKERSFYYQNEIASLHIEYEVLNPSLDLVISLKIYDQKNTLLAKTETSDHKDLHKETTSKGRHEIFFPISTSLFHEGEYHVKVEARLHKRKQIVTDQIILKLPIYKKEKETRFDHGQEKGGIFLGPSWELKNRIPLLTF